MSTHESLIPFRWWCALIGHKLRGPYYHDLLNLGMTGQQCVRCGKITLVSEPTDA